MREGWKEIRLGDIIYIKHGFGFKGKYFVDKPTENILLTPGNFSIGGGFKNDKLRYYEGPINEEFVLSEGDVIVTMTDLSKQADTLGYSAKIPKDNYNKYLHNQRIGLVSLLTDEFDLNFIYWLLRTHSYQRYISGSSSGATVKHTSPTKIYSAKLTVPKSIKTQRKIASILSAYDDLIENNLKRIKLLEEQAQQTYEEWFVRFKFPGHETAEFDEESGLPVGWEKVKCYDVMEVLSGGTPKTDVKEYWNGAIPFYTPKDASNGVYTNGTDKHITKLGLSKCNSKLYPKDTVFITARGTVGKINLAATDMAMNQSCYALRGREYVTQYYLYSSISNIVDSFKSVASGGVFDTIVVDTFKYLPFILPSSHLIEEYTKLITPIFKFLYNLLYQNQLLKEARDILLPRLMMGVIDVDGLELKENIDVKVE